MKQKEPVLKRRKYGCSFPGLNAKMRILVLVAGMLVLSADIYAKQFMDNLTTDFYGGTEDNITIGQNLDGNLQLAPYGLLGNWTTSVSPSEAALYLTGSAICNGKIYITGGFGSAERFSSGEVLYTALNKIYYGTVLDDGSITEWEEIKSSDEGSNLPRPTYGHGSIVVNGRIYIIGGRSTGNRPLDAVYWAKIIGHDGSIKAYYQSNTWTAVASLPEALFRPSVVKYEGRIYVIGGKNASNVPQDSVYIAPVQPDGNITGWTQSSAPLPTGLSGHNAVISNGRIYVLGGSTTGEEQGASSAVYIGNIDVNTGDIASWIPGTSLPETYYGAAAAVSGGKLWICGGIDSGVAKNRVYYARINQGDGLIPGSGQQDTWTRATDLPAAVYNHNLSAFNGHLFVIGGLNNISVQKQVYTATLVSSNATVARWAPATTLFLSAGGGHKYDTWTGHRAVLRSPLPSEDSESSASVPTVFVIGGGPNVDAYPGGVGVPGNPPDSYQTLYNSEIDSSGLLKNWAAPESGGSIPLNSILHASTLGDNLIYVVGGANTLNAKVWTNDAAALSIVAYKDWDPILDNTANSLEAFYQPAKTVVFYETEAGGGYSGGAGDMEETAAVPIIDAWGLAQSPQVVIYQPLIRFRVVSHNANLYVIGGISRANINVTTSSLDFQDKVWYCRPNPGGSINKLGDPGGWKETTLLPGGQALYDHAACVANNRVYIFGGRNAAGIPQDNVYFAQINSDATLGPWVPTSPLLEQLAEHDVVFTAGYFYVVGGENDAGTGVLQKIVYYCIPDPVTGLIPAPSNPGCWLPSDTELEYPVAGHSVVANNGFLYLLGGRYNPLDPHTSSAYMTSIIDMFHLRDLVYSWTGNFERYMDLGSDQLVEFLNWDGNPNSETSRIKCRYALEKGMWSDWELEQAVGPFIIQRFARYIHYKVNFETITNAALLSRTPFINRIYAEYAASKPVDNDAFLINHNRFDPQIEELLITYKTRDHLVSNVIIRIYNLEGELVQRQNIDIPPGTPLPATGTWIWDGTNANGEMVANGVYVIQYNSGDTHKLRKVVVFKR